MGQKFDYDYFHGEGATIRKMDHLVLLCNMN